MGLEIGVIFYSDKFSQVLTEVEDIQFDGTFYTVPMQFYQLWTLFARIGQHVVPCIHCILTSKQEALYTALITRIRELLPQLLPTHGMSDWEIGPRNAVKEVFQGIHLHGCYFHYAQSVWRKLGKLGLVNLYYNNQEFKQLARAYMSLPFLPEELIPTTFDLLDTHSLVVQEDDTRFRKLKTYLRKQWIIKTPANELSIYKSSQTTNNGAEIYHAKLKAEFVFSHPQIWYFIQILNDIITDTDLDVERLRNGIEISRPRKKKNIANDMLRRQCKRKLEEGVYTPEQYLFALGSTVELDTSSQQVDDTSSGSDEDNEQVNNQLLCCVCLQVRASTILFYPCRHARCCQDCSEQVGNLCPICRSTITDRIPIFI